MNNFRFAKNKWHAQRRKAFTRGIDFQLTFQEWYDWWLAQGIDKNKESTPNNGSGLCMCRKNDTGPYSLNNIYCATRSENSRDARTNIRLDYGPINQLHRSQTRIETPLGQFESYVDAAQAHRVSDVTIRNRIKSRPDEYRIVEAIEQHFQTPEGTFRSVRQAARELGVHCSTLHRWSRTNPTDYHYIEVNR